MIQTQWVILVCLLVLSVPGLVTMLPLFIIGVPSLSSSSEGGYTDLDQLTIIRLLAIDDSQPLPFSSQNRFIIIIIIYVITLLTMILIIKREMELVLEHRLKFLSHTTNRISVVYLKATEGLKNLNVKELTNLFIVSGLTSSTLDSSQTINVKRVFPLPDLVELKSLHGKRLKVLNSLEECQIEYIASFELSTGINEPVSVSYLASHSRCSLKDAIITYSKVDENLHPLLPHLQSTVPWPPTPSPLQILSPVINVTTVTPSPPALGRFLSPYKKSLTKSFKVHLPKFLIPTPKWMKLYITYRWEVESM